ncbi:adhesin [Bacillaceae bacterium Marseille-Q3522]|nr:adhesin [Bacillaceae bacterium Marseille-Q3522]
MIITDTAKTFITNIMEENNASTLRFAFAGAGCCGPKYALALEEALETDVVEGVNGIRVAIDAQIAETVKQLTLDYEESEQGAGLVVAGGSSCC